MCRQDERAPTEAILYRPKKEGGWKTRETTKTDLGKETSLLFTYDRKLHYKTNSFRPRNTSEQFE